MDIIQKYSDYMYRLIQTNPEKARKMLIRVFQGFGWYQKHFPDQKLPESKQYLANVCMQYMLKSFIRPEESALTSIFMPCEILQAMDIPAVCAEMFSTYMNGAYSERAFVEKAETEGIPETFCSYHKILIGGVLNGVMPAVKLIVNTSLACDANNLTFRFISHKTGSPQFYLDVPYERGESAVMYVAEELRELARAVERITGKKLDEERLRMIVNRSAETTANLRATIPYRKTKYLGGTLTSELYETLMVHNALGSEEALLYSRKQLQDYKSAPDFNGIKILWMHSNPFWQKPLKKLLNENPEQRIAVTEMGYDNWYAYDTDDPYRYMASRLVYNPYNGKLEARIRAAKEMADQISADGIICFCHWGCKETCGGSVRIKKELEDAGYPVLVLNGDGVDRQNASDGQAETRVSAFLEMLKGRKHDRG